MNSIRKQFLFLCAVGIVLALGPAAEADAVQIKRVTPQYMPREAFLRISEYFTGKENTGRRVILRTQAQERAGMYFVVMLDKGASELPPGSQVKLFVVTSDSPKTQTFTLPFPEQVANHCEVFAGLTGSDWPSKKLGIVAWKVILEDKSGQALAEDQSFLWKLPPPEKK